MTKKAGKVYIIYIEQDVEAADQLLNVLEVVNHGFLIKKYKVYKVDSSGTFLHEIEKEITKRDYALILFSRNFPGYHWVNSPMDRLRKEGVIIPIWLDKVENQSEFKNACFFDLATDRKKGFRELQSFFIREQLVVEKPESFGIRGTRTDKTPVALREWPPRVVRLVATSQLMDKEQFYDEISHRLDASMRDASMNELLLHLTHRHGGSEFIERYLAGESPAGVVRTTLEEEKYDYRSPFFYFLLEGEDVRENQVKCGAEVNLIFDYGVPQEEPIAVVPPNIVRPPSPDKFLDLEITIFPRGFSVRDNVFCQKTKFYSGQLESPICFQLKADDKPMEDSEVYVMMSCNGTFLYGKPIFIKIVDSLEAVDSVSVFQPMALNIDDAIKAQDRTAPDFELGVWADGDRICYCWKDNSKTPSHRGFFCEISVAILVNLLLSIQNRIESAATHCIWSKVDSRKLLSPGPDASETKAFEECLENVAVAGWMLYEYLCKDEGFKKILERVNDLKDGSLLSIFTRGVFLPWEILYPFPYDMEWDSDSRADHPIQHKQLWGYRFVIQCASMGVEHQPRLDRHRSGDIFISYNLNPAIDDDKSMVHSEFRPVETQKRWAEYYRSDSIKVEIQDNGEKIKKVLLSKNYDATMFYLYCHGQNEKPYSGDQTEKLQLDSEVAISPNFFSIKEPFAFAPIVFLNSCCSGAFSPLSLVNFLSRFIEKKSLGLIASSFPIPATFAAIFGNEIIKAYAVERKGAIGDILLDLRRKQLDDNKNPLGLFYSLYCPADATPKQPRQRVDNER